MSGPESSEEDRVRPGHQEEWQLEPEQAKTHSNVSPSNMDLDMPQLFEQALEQTRMAITITDVTRPDNPIIFANQAFTLLTGFESEDVIGKNCRFLQGPETDPAAVQAIRDCLTSKDVRVVEILNYRRDGTPFWNGLHIGPIYDRTGAVTHYYGSQWDITEIVEKRRRLELQAEVAEELRHRTRNLFSVMTSILRLSARDETDVGRLVERVTGRMEALDKAHIASLSEGEGGQGADLHDLVSTLLKPYGLDSDRRVGVSGDLTAIPRAAVTPLGLTLHELATNALKYGAFSQPGGRVEVNWTRENGILTLTWVETGGPAPDPVSELSEGSGSRITRGVLRSVGATVDYTWPPTGLTVRLTLPLDQD